jgi:sec-independent protein translocase protein TatA
MPFKMGPWEIALILVIILIVFGVGKLPQVGNAIGKGIRSFKKGQSGEDDEEEEEKDTKKVATSTKKTTRKKTAKS